MSSWTRVVVYDTPGVYTWTCDPRLYALDLIVRGGGGSGSSGMSHATTNQRLAGAGGGGGGVNATRRRVPLARLGDTEIVTVGAGGAATGPAPTGSGSWIPGNDGEASSFGELLSAEGGRGGGRAIGLPEPSIALQGSGGYAVMRGGNGASYATTTGVSPDSGIIRFLAGAAGGGRGAGYHSNGSAIARTLGGTSGLEYGGGTWRTAFTATHVSGNGGAGSLSSAAPGGDGFAPGGGGGGGAGGAPASGGGAGAPGSVVVIEYLREVEAAP